MVSVFQETWNEGEAAMAEFIKLPVGIENFERSEEHTSELQSR